MDLSNKMHFASAWGDVNLTLGVTCKNEDSFAVVNDPDGTIREGTRIEKAIFTTAEWQPTDWLSMHGGLRYATSVGTPEGRFETRPIYKDDTVDRSVGLSIKAAPGMQVYANYSDASRLPSLYESLFQGMNVNNPSMEAERVKTLDLGLNYQKTDLFGGDQLALKLSYFDMNIDGYLARVWERMPGSTRYGMFFANLDSASFEGVDLSAHYERGGFAAKFGAT